MLDIRPSCEHCRRALPPDTIDARICSFECTFCVHCAEGVLEGVCPNCGGGFVPRPIRPATNWRDGNHLDAYPADTAVTERPVDLIRHARLVERLKNIPPDQR